jgi:hypothetical protein
MAYTKLADVIYDTEIFKDMVEEFDPNPVAFSQSGIIREDTGIEISSGNIVSVPFYKPLGGLSQNLDGTDLTVNKTEAAKQSAVVIGRANVWGADDLTADFTTKDPMASIAEKVVQYWRAERQRILINQLNGIFASAAMATHVTDVSIDDGVNAAAANLINSDAIIEAIQKAVGDRGSLITAMSVHSKVYATMQKLNLIDFEPLSDQQILIPTFMGKRIIVDDAHTVEAGAVSGYKYTSYLYAQGAIGKAQGKVKVPVETERNALVAGGQEALIYRDRWIYHMYGTSFLSTSFAGVSPTDAELANGANWDKVYEDKNIPVVKLVTNG